MAHQHDAQLLGTLEKRHPGPKAFREFSKAFWHDGKLSSKDKHLVAVAIGQVTRCSYCIEHHAEIAKTLGASESEAIAASYITAALESLGESRLTLLPNTIDKQGTGDGAHEGVVEVAVEDDSAIRGTPMAKARRIFVNAALLDDTLHTALRWTIAAAVSHAKGREDLRVLFHNAAVSKKIDTAALDEAYAIAIILKSGAVYAHALSIAHVFAT